MLTLNIITPQTDTNPSNKVISEIPTSFNGLPVVRAPKDLGRRGLTNKNIIIHPSGIKLSKCPNGYIILCNEKDCSNIGSKEGIKCVKHAESFRYCRYPYTPHGGVRLQAECGKRAHFGNERRKPLYCSAHKHADMIDVVHNLCLADDCNLLAYFGLKDGPAKYCSKHKSHDMIDVLHKRCVFPGCDKIPSFGIEGGSVEYCSEHRPQGVVDVKHKRCIAQGCNITASFGLPGEKVTYCKSHKLDGMINFKTKKCSIIDCMIVPSFGIPGCGPEYCKRHKLDGMVNVKEKRCLNPDCNIIPCFGFEGGYVEYCSIHKLERMINLKNKKCIMYECKIQARFSLPGESPQYCAEHKLDGMINVKDKQCIVNGCNRQPSFCLLFDNSKIHCKRHSSLNEYTYQKRSPICSELKCMNRAIFIDPGDITIYPVRCNEHKSTGDIELIKRICPNCEEYVYYPSNQQYCMNCGKYREVLICSSREIAVETLLTNNNVKFIHDKRITSHGSRHRPDFLISSNFGYIIVEVDENQHNKHLAFEEMDRMKTIYHDVQHIAPRKQVLFIRYNPDKYEGPCVVDNKKRLEYLLLIINSMIQLPSIGTALGYIKLFYDDFDGNPIIKVLDINLNYNHK